jgi:hypothetical protein
MGDTNEAFAAVSHDDWTPLQRCAHLLRQSSAQQPSRQQPRERDLMYHPRQIQVRLPLLGLREHCSSQTAATMMSVQNKQENNNNSIINKNNNINNNRINNNSNSYSNSNSIINNKL